MIPPPDRTSAHSPPPSTPSTASPRPGPRSRPPVHGVLDRADPATRQSLQLLAEGITQLVGFEVAAVSVVRDTEHLQVLAVAGSEDAHEALDGTLLPIGVVLDELEQAEDWGWFKFVPQHRRTPGSEQWGWVPELVLSDDPGVWHPLDLLMAPLYDGYGVLRGLLSIDCPTDGRRPDLPRRRVLERYAATAAQALVLAVERQQLAEQVRLLSAAREIVRSVSGETTMAGQIDQIQASLVDCFRARGMWVNVFDRDDAGPGSIYVVDGRVQPLPRRLVKIAEALAVESWSAQQVAVFAHRHQDPRAPWLPDQDLAEITAFMDEVGVGTILFAPLGAGRECLGSLALTRARHDPDWSDLEMDTALEIGRDLGRLVINARAFEREREAVRELRALDAYKNGLITTLSHELKSPLAAMLGNLELLDEGADPPGTAEVQAAVLSAVGRSASRLVRVVENLLLLAKVGDPDGVLVTERVDLADVVAEVRAVSPLAQQHRLRVQVDGPGPVCAVGDPAELEILIGNLVGNALKYSAEDAPVLLTLRRQGDQAQLTCADAGIGISPTDRDRLFEEFFRSDAEDVRGQVGTGLGLAIVDRIVVKHGGRIDIESELGVGTAVHVTLPWAD